MNDFERLVTRLREEPGLSRNQNFDELSRPEARRARRLLKRLAGFAEEIDRGGTGSVEPHQQGYVVTIEFSSVRFRHQAFLTAEEHALLLLDEDLARKLSPRS